jgi:PHP family Zn ribbon phosphoesterase
MQTFRADLHVHTVLSPCAEIEMIPPLIVQEAIERQIDLIAITDHNASANVAAVQKAAQGSGLVVLPGMEVQTCEDVHLLTLFESLAALEEWQSRVDAALPDLPNRTRFFGEQFIVDETGEFIRNEGRLLLTATRFSIDEIFECVNTLGGIVIPAHVERTSYGLLPTLGLISDQWHLPALEISRHTTPERAAAIFPAVRNSHPISER